MVILKKFGIRDPLSFDADGDAMLVQLHGQTLESGRARGALERLDRARARSQMPFRDRRRRRRTVCRLRRLSLPRSLKPPMRVAVDPEPRRRRRVRAAPRHRRAIVA